MTTEYDVMGSCNKCGGVNDCKTEDADHAGVIEASTICRDCGFTDYWYMGHFESGQVMAGVCRKYSFDQDAQDRKELHEDWIDDDGY